jgi:hypothetical protein
MAKVTAAFRIAMRTTDDGWWIGLLAPIEGYDGALEIGRIRRSAVEVESVRRHFLDAMRLTLEAILRNKGIRIAEWQEQIPMGDSKGRA